MTGQTHSYAVDIKWVGNTGTGTADFTKYLRDHIISAAGKADIAGSADPAFRGDPTRWNPEETLVSSIATCHKLWYLHLCYDAGIVVTGYEDHATGEMAMNADGSGQFSSVHLAPRVMIAKGGDTKLAKDLHAKVGALCFIARSVNFPIKHDAMIMVEK
ncbi:MAG: OsmC family protein [Amylibacter sp.]|nr:OsmC family protein [Amylibacter sp.]